MDPIVFNIMLAVGGVTAISLVGIFTVSMSERRLSRILPFLVALAAGGLLGGAVFHLIPESLEELTGSVGAVAIIAGILAFFVLERVLRWHHHHAPHHIEATDECREEIQPYGHLILIADVLHNMLDGVVIAAAFLLGTEAGIIATLAVALHEIPQEIGDFGVLLNAGYSKTRALVANLLSGLSAFIGAGLTIAFASTAESLVPALAAFAAGGFLYIAIVDLMPELRSGAPGARGLGARLAVLLLGLGAMWMLTVADIGHEDADHESVHMHTDLVAIVLAR